MDCWVCSDTFIRLSHGAWISTLCSIYYSYVPSTLKVNSAIGACNNTVGLTQRCCPAFHVGLGAVHCAACGWTETVDLFSEFNSLNSQSIKGGQGFKVSLGFSVYIDTKHVLIIRTKSRNFFPGAQVRISSIILHIKAKDKKLWKHIRKKCLEKY